MKNTFGWIGVALILLAFILTTFHIIDPSNIWYGVLNAIGALGIIVSSSMKKDFQPVVLNVVWLVVAVVGIIIAIFS